MKSFSPIDTLTAQIARFCANDGSWGSDKVRFTEWNLELINSMVNTMSSRWDTYTKMSAALIGDLEIKILASVDRLISQVEGIPPEDLGKKPLSASRSGIMLIFCYQIFKERQYLRSH